MKDARAQDIFDKITKYFEDKQIPYKENLIGFASDGANVMTGKHNSVMSRLKEEIPNIFLMRCICHSFHLCASVACEKLPRGVEDLVRDIYIFFQIAPNVSKCEKNFKFFRTPKYTKFFIQRKLDGYRWKALY